MNSNRQTEAAGTMNLGDIYFVIFRHKWKIILLGLAGVVAAVVFYQSHPPVYKSEAELFIRYITDSRPLTAPADNSMVTSDPGASIINSEMQILTSFDLAQQVANAIGPEKILAKVGGGKNPVAAAMVVRSGLKVSAAERSSVINVAFQHPDPAVVQPVLSEIISDYLSKHTEIHQPLGTEDDFLAEQTSQLRAQIVQTERELMMAQTNLGIISLDETKKNIAEQIAKYQSQLIDVQVELATRQGMLAKTAGTSPASLSTTNLSTTNAVTTTGIPPDQAEQYKKLGVRLALLQKRNDDFATQGYTEDSVLVKDVAAQIKTNTELKKQMEQKYPGLLDSGTPSPLAAGLPADLSTTNQGSAQTAMLESRSQVLQAQLDRLRLEAAAIGEAEPKILDLKRVEEIQKQNMQYYLKNLDDARISEAMGAGRISGIKPIQQPTPPFLADSKRIKIAAGLLVGGFFGGLALAFLIELILDRSVKRPTEIETRLKLPLFLSIPNMHLNGSRSKSRRRQISLPDAGGSESDVADGKTGNLEIAPWSASNAMRSFYEALRDRIVVHFEIKKLTRNPKLVAVTSANRGAGVTTIAMGLAASLSETGEGNVLLVDMNAEQGAVQQFYKGKPGCPLDHAFEAGKRDGALMQDNLYVVSDSSNGDKLPRIMPKRFSTLLPKFKASDYDYIIFDMPPVTQTSVTPRLAGHMDMVLMVVEAEKTDRDIVRRATQLLDESKANVIAVLNKTRKYVPDRLHQEYLSDS